MKIINKLDSYGIFGFIRLIWWKVLTVLFYRQCSLIRFPLYVRGKKHILFGSNLTTGVGLRIEVFPREKHKKKLIFIGSNVQINDYVHIACIENIKIGNNVLIASKVFITDHDHGDYKAIPSASMPSVSPRERVLASRPVIIEDNVWIGEGVSILPGVVIGSGSIIGANSVVTKSIDINTLAIGNPARPFKFYCESKNAWQRCD